MGYNDAHSPRLMQDIVNGVVDFFFINVGPFKSNGIAIHDRFDHIVLLIRHKWKSDNGNAVI